MRIYTRSGDKGETSLVYGKRIAKNDIRVEAYGTCDEANSMIGLALSYIDEKSQDLIEIQNSLIEVQTVLFHVGAELSTPADKEVQWKLEEQHVKTLEALIDKWDAVLPDLHNFILPGGHPAGATLHVARTIVRRAERCAVAIDEVSPVVIAYLNRLSDFLFVAARYVNFKYGEEEKSLQV